MADWKVDLYNIDPATGVFTRIRELVSYLPFQGKEVLSGIGMATLTFNIESENINRSQINRYKTHAFFKRDGVYQWGGPVVRIAGSKSGVRGTVTFQCLSYFTHLLGRELSTSYSKTDTPVSTIVDDLVTLAQAETYGKLGLTVATVGTLPNIDESLEAGANIGRAITNLSDNINGFEFIEAYDVDGDGLLTGIRLVIAPGFGSFRSDLPAVKQKDTSGYQWSTAADMYNSVKALGFGTGEDVVTGFAENTSSQKAYTLRQTTLKRPTSKRKLFLDETASTQLNLLQAERFNLGFDLHQRSGITINKVNLGDILKIDIDNGDNNYGTFKGSGRIYQLGFAIDQEGSEFITPVIDFIG